MTSVQAAVWLQTSRNPALEGGGWSARRSGRLTTYLREMPISHSTGGSVGFGAGKSYLTWIRCPDRVAHSQSL